MVHATWSVIASEKTTIFINLGDRFAGVKQRDKVIGEDPGSQKQKEQHTTRALPSGHRRLLPISPMGHRHTTPDLAYGPSAQLDLAEDHSSSAS